MDYGGAFNPVKGHCFRLVSDQAGKPTGCPEPVLASGSLVPGRRVGSTRHA